MKLEWIKRLRVWFNTICFVSTVFNLPLTHTAILCFSGVLKFYSYIVIVYMCRAQITSENVKLYSSYFISCFLNIFVVIWFYCWLLNYTILLNVKENSRVLSLRFFNMIPPFAPILIFYGYLVSCIQRYTYRIGKFNFLYYRAGLHTLLMFSRFWLANRSYFRYLNTPFSSVFVYGYRTRFVFLQRNFLYFTLEYYLIRCIQYIVLHIYYLIGVAIFFFALIGFNALYVYFTVLVLWVDVWCVDVFLFLCLLGIKGVYAFAGFTNFLVFAVSIKLPLFFLEYSDYLFSDIPDNFSIFKQFFSTLCSAVFLVSQKLIYFCSDCWIYVFQNFLFLLSGESVFSAHFRDLFFISGVQRPFIGQLNWFDLKSILTFFNPVALFSGSWILASNVLVLVFVNSVLYFDWFEFFVFLNYLFNLYFNGLIFFIEYLWHYTTIWFFSLILYICNFVLFGFLWVSAFTYSGFIGCCLDVLAIVGFASDFFNEVILIFYRFWSVMEPTVGFLVNIDLVFLTVVSFLIVDFVKYALLIGFYSFFQGLVGCVIFLYKLFFAGIAALVYFGGWFFFIILFNVYLFISVIVKNCLHIMLVSKWLFDFWFNCIFFDVFLLFDSRFYYLVIILNALLLLVLLYTVYVLYRGYFFLNNIDLTFNIFNLNYCSWLKTKSGNTGADAYSRFFFNIDYFISYGHIAEVSLNFQLPNYEKNYLVYRRVTLLPGYASILTSFYFFEVFSLRLLLAFLCKNGANSNLFFNFGGSAVVLKIFTTIWLLPVYFGSGLARVGNVIHVLSHDSMPRTSQGTYCLRWFSSAFLPIFSIWNFEFLYWVNEYDLRTLINRGVSSAVAQSLPILLQDRIYDWQQYRIRNSLFLMKQLPSTNFTVIEPKFFFRNYFKHYAGLFADVETLANFEYFLTNPTKLLFTNHWFLTKFDLFYLAFRSFKYHTVGSFWFEFYASLYEQNVTLKRAEPWIFAEFAWLYNFIATVGIWKLLPAVGFFFDYLVFTSLYSFFPIFSASLVNSIVDARALFSNIVFLRFLTSGVAPDILLRKTRTEGYPYVFNFYSLSFVYCKFLYAAKRLRATPSNNWFGAYIDFPFWYHALNPYYFFENLTDFPIYVSEFTKSELSGMPIRRSIKEWNEVQRLTMSVAESGDRFNIFPQGSLRRGRNIFFFEKGVELVSLTNLHKKQNFLNFNVHSYSSNIFVADFWRSFLPKYETYAQKVLFFGKYSGLRNFLGDRVWFGGGFYFYKFVSVRDQALLDFGIDDDPIRENFLDKLFDFRFTSNPYGFDTGKNLSVHILALFTELFDPICSLADLKLGLLPWANTWNRDIFISILELWYVRVENSPFWYFEYLVLFLVLRILEFISFFGSDSGLVFFPTWIRFALLSLVDNSFVVGLSSLSINNSFFILHNTLELFLVSKFNAPALSRLFFVKLL